LRPRVKTKKHFVQTTLTTVAAGATGVVTYLDAVESTTANAANEVAEGAIVTAFYAEMWVAAKFDDQFQTAVLAKLPGGVGNVLNADLVNLFAYDNKKNILFTEQGLASDGSSPPLPLFRDWFKVPKTKQRMGLGDRLQFAIASRGDQALSFCGFFMYKEQG